MATMQEEDEVHHYNYIQVYTRLKLEQTIFAFQCLVNLEARFVAMTKQT